MTIENYSNPNYIKIENHDILSKNNVFNLFKVAELKGNIFYNFLHPDNYGIHAFEIDKNALRKKIFKIKEIDCILSDGSVFYHRSAIGKTIEINLKNIDPFENDGKFIYLLVVNAEPSFQSAQKEIINCDTSIYTVEKIVSLLIDDKPPTECGYLPIARLQLTTEGIGLGQFQPPSLNIKSDQYIMQKLEDAMELIQNKFAMIKREIENDRYELNPKKHQENLTKVKCLKDSLNYLESIANKDQVLPIQMHLTLNKMMGSVITLNPSLPLVEVAKFDILHYKEIFHDVFKNMTDILNKEISEKYRLLFFTKKDDFFYLRLPKQNSNIFKVAIKKSARISDAQLMEWMQNSLVCDKSEYHFMIEKRSLGYERKFEFADIETNLKNDYIFYSVKVAPSVAVNDNILVISQSSIRLAVYEPDAIALYWELSGN